VPHVGTHGIRHRSATDIANSGIPVKVGMALTAHKTVAMFMRYVHTEDKPVREAAELVANRRKTITSAERWSVRTLRERIDSMLYERTALSKKPDETIAQELATMRDAQRMSPALVMRDPYILDFLGLRDTWQEGDLEAAIIREMESFLLELGAGFSFVARQKRIQIDGEDFHLDLLFYNRKLRRLVAVELKVGEFKAAYKGQMELYLRWLDKHEREPEEASPLGIILCTGKKSSRSSCWSWTSRASTLPST
jgi:predicted nuclease of restriction endonuclease-like (RecB) superfamily